jgi:hypothetical protein
MIMLFWTVSGAVIRAEPAHESYEQASTRAVQKTYERAGRPRSRKSMIMSGGEAHGPDEEESDGGRPSDFMMDRHRKILLPTTTRQRGDWRSSGRKELWASRGRSPNSSSH